ncbi:MAG: acyl-CoA desaturase [Holophagaceae bacterium]|nr:acyl-CoA desaturase [Holophagaceae bacterium]
MRKPFTVTVTSVSFVLVHLGCLAALWLTFSWKLVALCVALYLVRMFAVTAGYHRYFSHRAYRMGRVPQFLMAFLAQTSAQKGVLWWAANHRHHHRHSDTPQDLHSPVVDGFWWSHLGWVLSDAYDTYDPAAIEDFARFPELRFLDAYHWLCPWLLGALVFGFGIWTGLGGWETLVWGFAISTVLLWHGTFCINSLTHVWGTRRFETGDQSRNNLVLALITLGEGWHNNHHHYQASCRQGIRWWEVDPTFYALKVLSWLRVVRDLRPFPQAAMGASRS